MSTTPADRRRELPDQPGVYLFRDAGGKVLYVGKATSIRKRVASHFSNPSTRAGKDLVAMIDRIEALIVHTEAEALLAEQNFIKQYKPRFNIRLRDDKSYPYIAISLDEDFPRVYFTRERHRRDRAYFGPYSNAKRVRSTLDVLARCSCSAPARAPSPAVAAARRAWTTTSSAVRPRASATSAGRTIAAGSTAWSTSSPAVTRRSSGPWTTRCARRPPSSALRTRPGSATGCGRCARCWSASGSPTRAGGRWMRSPSRCRRPRPTRRRFRSATGSSPTARASRSEE